MDRPTNLMVINAVTWFDEPLDWNRVREIVDERMVSPGPAVPAAGGLGVDAATMPSPLALTNCGATVGADLCVTGDDRAM